MIRCRGLPGGANCIGVEAPAQTAMTGSGIVKGRVREGTVTRGDTRGFQATTGSKCLYVSICTLTRRDPPLNRAFPPHRFDAVGVPGFTTLSPHETRGSLRCAGPLRRATWPR